jgi:SOS-response transcriptional repressor LexA
MSTTKETINSASNVTSLVNWRATAALHKQELSILPAGSSFQVQILGDALTGVFIQHGDVIDCERTDSLEQGQIGLLKTPYGLMLRRYFRDGDVVRLEPASVEYATLCLPPSDVQIIASLIRLERWFVSYDEMEAAS